jgi:hypothetical protein
MLIRLFACAWALLCAATAGAQELTTLPVPTVEYAADRVIETDSGTFGGRVYAVQGKERAEMEAGGMKSVMILRFEERKGWMLLPAQRMYQELDFAKAREQAGKPSDDVKISAVGPDTVEGHAVTKYKLVMKDGSAGGFVWITPEGIAIKIDMVQKSGKKHDRMTMTLQNLQIGAQDPALFEVPAGWSKMPAFGGMFGAGGGLGGGAKKLFGGR